MSARGNLDISAYLVIGPENTLGRPVAPIVEAAVEVGYTCVQIRSKAVSASELIALTGEAAAVIEKLGRSGKTVLVVDDRLDVVLAAKKRGIWVDGIHVGQTDIPVDVCREYLGEDAIVGLSARTEDLFECIETMDARVIDYIGAGPLHETQTKPNCGLSADGRIITWGFDDIERLARLSPIPIVIGGGVKLADIPALAKTGVDGFFVVSAITEADDPKIAAADLLRAWKENLNKA
jgi:thiamine-phosphate diphosphorylase